MAQNKPTTLTRFTESAWRITFYAFAFVYGIYTLSDKPWMWNSIHCFIDYPHHSVSNTEWWYYNIELAFYLSLIVSQFYDIQRKDFWQMFIHHIVTVMLLCFSWACNLVRIGTLVLVIHDFADVPLEGAKLARYVRNDTVSNIVFAVFTVSWIVSRLGLLPYRVIAYSSHYALEVVPMFPAYWIFNALLCALQVLHIVWTWLILRIAYNAIYNDGVKDLRESDETTDCDLSEELEPLKESGPSKKVEEEEKQPLSMSTKVTPVANGLVNRRSVEAEPVGGACSGAGDGPSVSGTVSHRNGNNNLSTFDLS
jgi:ceramide synthetase